MRKFCLPTSHLSIEQHASMGPQLYRCGNFEKLFGYAQRQQCFNGAATLSLRKYATFGRQCDLRSNASMGPQLYRCGNMVFVKPRLVYLNQLQWGRNFIVAEIRKKRQSKPRRNCFNGAATLSLRKYRGPVPTTDLCNGLQWGRNFIVAEISAMPQPWGGHSLLQWGRNFIVAEIPFSNFKLFVANCASMGPQLYRCGNPPSQQHANRSKARFNGAATLSLRKCVDIALRDKGLARASMGPQLYRCGNTHKRQKGSSFSIASMGPQLYRCGNVIIKPAPPVRGRGFNGAATLSLRK